MDFKEQQEQARKRYNGKVHKAQTTYDISDAALEYITALEEIIDKIKTPA